MRSIILITILSSMGFSAQAFQGEITFKQEDGTTFKGHLKGDEWFSWVENKQTQVIKYNSQSKNYEYGKIADVNGTLDLVPNGLKVNNEETNTSTSAIQSKSSASPTKVDKTLLKQIWKNKRAKALSHRR